MTVAADLADAAAARAMVERVEAELGAIDILVTSAGAAAARRRTNLNPAAWRAAMDAKYFTYINVIDPVVKRMAARGRGVIVNIVGNGGKVASPMHLPGGAANAALMLATVGLANAYAAKGVRILAINPGLTKTTRVARRHAGGSGAAGHQRGRGAAAQHRPHPARTPGGAGRDRGDGGLRGLAARQLSHRRDHHNGRRKSPQSWYERRNQESNDG